LSSTHYAQIRITDRASPALESPPRGQENRGAGPTPRAGRFRDPPPVHGTGASSGMVQNGILRYVFIRHPTGRLRTLACVAQPGQAGAAAGMNNCPWKSPPPVIASASFDKLRTWFAKQSLLTRTRQALCERLARLGSASHAGGRLSAPRSAMGYPLRILTITLSNGISLPLLARACWAMNSNPPQHGTSMRTTFRLRTSLRRRICVSLAM